MTLVARAAALMLVSTSAEAFAEELSVSDRVTLLKAMKDCWSSPLTAQEVAEGGISGEASASVEGIFRKLLSAEGKTKGQADFRKAVKRSFQSVGDPVASLRVQRCYDGAFGIKDSAPKAGVGKKAQRDPSAKTNESIADDSAWRQLLSDQYSGPLYLRARDDRYVMLKDDSLGIGLGRERTAWTLEPGSHGTDTGYFIFRRIDGHKRALAVMGGIRGPVQLFWNKSGNCDHCRPENHELFKIHPTGNGNEVRIRGVAGNYLIDSAGDIVASSSVGDVFIAEF